MYMRDETHWRQTLVDRMSGRDVKIKDLSADTGVPRSTIKNYFYGVSEPSLYNGLVIMYTLGVRSLDQALAWYDSSYEEVVY